MLIFVALSFFLLVSMAYHVLSLCVVIVLTLPYIFPLFFYRNLAKRLQIA